MKTKRKSRSMLLVFSVLLGGAFELGVFRGQAHAVVGRPLTPFSYAGVARRTTRRTVAYSAATRPYAYAAPYPPPAPYYW